MLSLGGTDVGPAELAIRLDIGRIEVPDRDERRVKVDERCIERSDVEQAFVVRRAEIVGVVRSAVKIRARVEGIRDGLLGSVGVIMLYVDALDRAAVPGNPRIDGGPVPMLAKEVLQQKGIRTRRYPNHRVVRAHESADLGVTGTGLERPRVELGEVLLRDDGVESEAQVPLPVLEVIRSEVLARGNDALVGRVHTTLQAGDEVVYVCLQVERIFSRRLLA